MIERKKRSARKEIIYNPYKQHSGSVIPNWLLPIPYLSSRSKLVWVKLVDHNRNGECFPNQKLLSEECGLSEPTIRKAIKELVEHKLLKVENPKGSDRLKHFNNKYYFLLPKENKLFLFSPGEKEAFVPRESEGIVPNKRINNKRINNKSELLRSSVVTSYEVTTSNAASDDADVTIRKKRKKRDENKEINLNLLSDEIEEMQRNDIKTMRGKKIRKGNKKLRSKVIMPESIKNIIEHWNSLPLRKLKYNTKKHQRTVDTLKKLLRGKFFTGEIEDERIKKYADVKFTCGDLIKSINNFALVVDNSFYSPTIEARNFYKKLSLEGFIYYDGSFSNSKPYSPFLKFLENTPKPKSAPVDPIPDKHPQLSLRLKNLYTQNVLGGMNGNMSDRDLNCFKHGAERLHKFWMSNRRYISTLLRGESELCDLLYKALESTTGGKMQKITPVRFCSDFTFNHTLPTYLVDQGMESSNLVRPLN